MFSVDPFYVALGPQQCIEGALVCKGVTATGSARLMYHVPNLLLSCQFLPQMFSVDPFYVALGPQQSIVEVGTFICEGTIARSSARLM